MNNQLKPVVGQRVTISHSSVAPKEFPAVVSKVIDKRPVRVTWFGHVHTVVRVMVSSEHLKADAEADWYASAEVADTTMFRYGKVWCHPIDDDYRFPIGWKPGEYRELLYAEESLQAREGSSGEEAPQPQG